MAGAVASPSIGAVIGVIALLVFGLPSSEVWLASLSFAQLAVRWHTPLRLVQFLEDARKRDVLRTVGSAYQFRHARLQDRLAQRPTHNLPS